MFYLQKSEEATPSTHYLLIAYCKRCSNVHPVAVLRCHLHLCLDFFFSFFVFIIYASFFCFMYIFFYKFYNKIFYVYQVYAKQSQIEKIKIINWKFFFNFIFIYLFFFNNIWRKNQWYSTIESVCCVVYETMNSATLFIASFYLFACWTARAYTFLHV